MTKQLITVMRIISGKRIRGYPDSDVKPPDQHIWRCDSGALVLMFQKALDLIERVIDAADAEKS